MIEIVKLAIPVKTNAYDGNIAQLINAAVQDLRIAGIPVDGVNINVTWTGGRAVVTDTSTIDDPLLIRAICAYVRAHFGSPDDYDRLKAAYDENKAQLQTATGYGLEDDDGAQ